MISHTLHQAIDDRLPLMKSAVCVSENSFMDKSKLTSILNKLCRTVLLYNNVLNMLIKSHGILVNVKNAAE